MTHPSPIEAEDAFSRFDESDDRVFYAKDRVLLVEQFFARSRFFERPQRFTSKGKPRPKDDKYAHLGIPSDPIYAVYAAKKGGLERKERPKLWQRKHLPLRIP